MSSCKDFMGGVIVWKIARVKNVNMYTFSRARCSAVGRSATSCCCCTHSTGMPHGCITRNGKVITAIPIAMHFSIHLLYARGLLLLLGLVVLLCTVWFFFARLTTVNYNVRKPGYYLVPVQHGNACEIELGSLHKLCSLF